MSIQRYTHRNQIAGFISAEDTSLLYEIRTIQTSMQQLFGGLENLKTELLLRQQNVTTSILGTVSALQGAVRVLTNKVDDVQIKLSEVDETVANLTKSVENIDIEITDGSEVPVTVETTPEYSSYNATFPAFYNYTMPPTPGKRSKNHIPIFVNDHKKMFDLFGHPQLETTTSTHSLDPTDFQFTTFS